MVTDEYLPPIKDTVRGAGTNVMQNVPSTSSAVQTPAIAVVIPCFRVTAHVASVLAAIGPEVHRIYCVDDACPDDSGNFIRNQCTDPRIVVLRHEVNQGVGGATRTGYLRALADGADIVVKVDGDGQMNPALIPRFVAPITSDRADYTKGNRFFRLDSLRGMPASRKLGNAILSFLTKLSSGYWSVFDPTNGYTAIHAKVLREMPLDRVSSRWFFESDMLFRLNTLGAVVEDVPLDSVYGAEVSNLAVRRVAFEFLVKNLGNFFKRLFYNYFLRNFSVASLELLAGCIFLPFGVIFGAIQWSVSLTSGVTVSAGTVMLAALPTLLGGQLLLSFLAYDMATQPRVPLHLRL
jgi:glycosyltransferase involved in cell wall biosynthesis